MRDEGKIKETAGKDDDNDEERKEAGLSRAAGLTREDEERKEKQEQEEKDKEVTEKGGLNQWSWTRTQCILMKHYLLPKSKDTP